MMNDPFWLTKDQADALTDRQAVEWHVKRYEEHKAEDFDARVKAELAEREKVEAAKSLAQRKAEYWAFCRDSGCKEADIQREWDKQTG